MLTPGEVEHFERHGYVIVRGAMERDVAARCRAVLHLELARLGVDPDEPLTWTDAAVRFPCPEGGPFVAAGTSDALYEAYHQLAGVDPRKRRPGVGGQVVARFPCASDDQGDGWHIDGSYRVEGDDRYWVNVHSERRALLTIFLFSDVDDSTAPTAVLSGSHLDVPAILSPAGRRGLPFDEVVPRLPPSTLARDVHLLTGRAGDVAVCHPFLVHRGTSRHLGDRPRLIAQPGVRLDRPYRLVRPGESPVERTIVDGLPSP